MEDNSRQKITQSEQSLIRPEKLRFGGKQPLLGAFTQSRPAQGQPDSVKRGDEVIFQILGAALAGLIVVSIALSIVLFVRMRMSARQQMDLTLELLREEFAAAARVRVGRPEEQAAWLGFRSFLVERKIKDGPSSDSFWLVPQDERPLPDFQPGQYLTVRVRMPGQAPDQKEIVERRYPITSEPNEQFYCISVERLPDMMLSGCLHQGIAAGTVVDVLAPRGELGLDEQRGRPVVLIADGVGTKPCVSMLETAADSNLDRPVTVIYGVRRGHDHGVAEQLEALATRMPNLRVLAVEETPNDDDSMASCRLDFSGTVSIAAIREALPSNNFDFQLWGPAPMVESLTSELKHWNVPGQRIRTEVFGAPLAPMLGNLISQETPRVNGTKVTSASSSMTWKPERAVAEEEPGNTYSRVLKNPALRSAQKDSKGRRGPFSRRGRVASS